MNRKTQQLMVTIGLIIGLTLIAIVGWFYLKGNNYKKYKNEAFQFSIQYPSDWTVAENTNGAAVILYAPLENDLDFFQESVNVVVQDLSRDPISLHDYTEKAIYQMKVVFKEAIEIIDSSTTTLNGRPAHRFVFKTVDNSDLSLQYMCVWTIDGYKAYQLTYTTISSRYEMFLSKINFMINSFRILQ